MAYAKERKEAVLKKMMPPHNMALSVLAEQEGISEGTLYLWRQEARRKGMLLPDADTTPRLDKQGQIRRCVGNRSAQWGRTGRVLPQARPLRGTTHLVETSLRASQRLARSARKAAQTASERATKGNATVAARVDAKREGIGRSSGLVGAEKKKWTRFGGSERKNDSLGKAASSGRMGRRSPKKRSALGALLRSVGYLKENVAALGAWRGSAGRQKAQRETSGASEQIARRGKRTSACGVQQPNVFFDASESDRSTTGGRRGVFGVRSDVLSNPTRRRRSASARTGCVATKTRRGENTRSERSMRSMDVGYHVASGSRARFVLLLVPVARPLQPKDRGLGST